MTIVVSIPTGRPKRDIIELAFADCGLAGYEFDRTPEEQSLALRQLNALMLEHPWNALGYKQPTYGVGRVEAPSGLPDDTINTVAMYLALRIAPSMGVTLSAEYRAAMARSFANLQSQYASIPSMSVPGNTVRGSGVRRWRRLHPYTPVPAADIKRLPAETVCDDEPEWGTREW